MLLLECMDAKGYHPHIHRFVAKIIHTIYVPDILVHFGWSNYTRSDLVTFTYDLQHKSGLNEIETSHHNVGRD